MSAPSFIELAIPDNHILLSGMAVGHAELSANENTLAAQSVVLRSLPAGV